MIITLSIARTACPRYREKIIKTSLQGENQRSNLLIVTK